MEETDFSLPETATNEIVLRAGELEDIVPCSLLDASYTTDYVWQMHFQETEHTAHSQFTRVRLPRSMPVAYPHNRKALLQLLQHVSYLLVAEQNGEPVGFVCGNIEPWRGAITIEAMIVSAEMRRQGIGKKLWRGVAALAQENDCTQISVALQTKNDPAISFVHKRGATLCGYDDRLFPNGDIALLFSLSL